jgi:hypothetical protein
LRLLLRHKVKAELTEQKAAFAHLINGQRANRSGIGVAPVPS